MEGIVKIKSKPDNLITCPKCKFQSGDDWSQCGGKCPMTMSPHYNQDERIKYTRKPIPNATQKYKIEKLSEE
ncbi:MAG TPA: hypothetical protein DDY18_11840 [Flavobacterium sp.]|nr:hypothetical protein [Flavobacterium sp.]